MKRNYIKPEMTIELHRPEDVIVTSSEMNYIDEFQGWEGGTDRNDFFKPGN